MVSEAIAEERLVPDSLAPVEGTAPSCRRTGTPIPVKGSVKCPLFEHDRPDHGLTARTADRAVLIELRRLIAVNHILLEVPFRTIPAWRWARSQGSSLEPSSVPAGTDAPKFRARAIWLRFTPIRWSSTRSLAPRR